MNLPADMRRALGLHSATQSAGLSLGDRVCLALGKSRRAEVLTSDRAWEAIAERAGVIVTLIR